MVQIRTTSRFVGNNFDGLTAWLCSNAWRLVGAGLVVLTFVFRKEAGIFASIRDDTAGKKDSVDGNKYYKADGVINKAAAKLNHDPNRIRFTQMWSSGHVGTRFLTGLLAAPGFYNKSLSCDYMAWNEYELPLMTKPLQTLSLYDFRAMMNSRELRATTIEKRNFERYILNKQRLVDGKIEKRIGWYGGTQIKKWNKEGNITALESYLRNERMTALRSVYERYNREGKSKEQLRHFIKVGHTAVFFDLSDYYKVLSSTSLEAESGKTAANIDVDFVRIRRNRVDVANSFVGDNNRKGPIEYNNRTEGIVTNPAMKTSLLRLSSLGGPLPDEIWWNWTIFQRYLWFADEVEARWKIFLEKHPNVRYFELAYSKPWGSNKFTPQLDPSDIDDLALNFLGIGRPLSPYINKISKQSHLSSKKSQTKPETESKEQQAIEYSRQAPWCLQYVGRSDNVRKDVIVAYEYPKLDCALSA